MIVPNDFDQARPYDGSEYTALPIGGHICKIIGARATKSRNGNDMIEVAFDIAEGGEYDGRFQEQFAARRAQAADAKWPNGGMFRANVYTRDGKTNPYFKGLITAVEESNTGYSFKAAKDDENTLKGRMVGFNFGEEEYLNQSAGEVRVGVKAFYAVSVQTVRNGIEPPKRKTYTPPAGSMPAQSQGFSEVQDDELPF